MCNLCAFERTSVYILYDILYYSIGRDKSKAQTSSDFSPVSQWQVFKAHLFEIEIDGDSSWIIVREFKNGNVILHSISDSPSIKERIKKE